MNKIKLATRKSPLALKQANMVRDYLIDNKTFNEIILVPMTTAGDKVDSQTFKRDGGKGLFLKSSRAV
jgi:hydroxymethylbilane synthase